MRRFDTVTDPRDMSLRKLWEAAKASVTGFQENGNVQTLLPPGQGMLLCTDVLAGRQLGGGLGAGR